MEALLPARRWSPGEVSDGAEAKEAVRCCEEAFLSRSNPLETELAATLQRHLEAGLQLYRERHPMVPAEVSEGFRLVRYGPGDRYGAHCDAGSHFTATRVLSAVWFLNDQFAGGELSFPRQEVRIDPHPGRMVLFPSNFVYPHAVGRIESGRRYVALTWLRPAPRTPTLPPWLTSAT